MQVMKLGSVRQQTNDLLQAESLTFMHSVTTFSQVFKQTANESLSLNSLSAVAMKARSRTIAKTQISCEIKNELYGWRQTINKLNYKDVYAPFNKTSFTSFCYLSIEADMFLYLLLVMKGRMEYQGQAQRLAYFEDQLTGENKLVRLILCYQPHSNVVNLTLSFVASNLEKELVSNAQIFYMNSTTRICHYLGIWPFKDDIFMEMERNKKDRMHFKFRKVEVPSSAVVSSAIQESPPTNRKSKERTIVEVRQHLQNWKRVYRNPKESGQYYTLQQAADKIGLPKKTLDDYERHIRIAEAMQFDFETNKHAGMGLLRNFVKQQNQVSKVTPPRREEIIEPDIFLNMD